jgi:hypothetical protein
VKELSERKNIRTAGFPLAAGVVRKARARIFVPFRHEKSADERQVQSILAGD